MPSPYEYSDYRDYLREEIAARKAHDSSINFQNLAITTRVQKPLISKVINLHNHFNSDQLYLACQYLHLATDEYEYLEATRDLSTTIVPAKKLKLEKFILEKQSEHQRTDKHIEVDRKILDSVDVRQQYYLNPIYQIIHIALSVDRYRADQKLLSIELLLPLEKVKDAIHKLEQMGVIRRNGSEIEIIQDNLHISKEAPEFIAWQNQLRLLALNRSQVLPTSDSYAFSVVFSGDENARKIIHKKILQLIKETQKVVGDSVEQNIYQLNFDLFNWNYPKI